MDIGNSKCVGHILSESVARPWSCFQFWNLSFGGRLTVFGVHCYVVVLVVCINTRLSSCFDRIVTWNHLNIPARLNVMSSQRQSKRFICPIPRLSLQKRL